MEKKKKKVKKFLLLGCLLLVGVAVMAAAPANNSATSTEAAKTVDSAAAADAWQILDSLIVIKTDSCDTYYQYCAQITLWPGQAIYIGLFDGATAKATDTVLYPEGFEGPFKFPVGAYCVDSLRSQTDANDTIYVKAAVSGITEYENVACSSLYITGAVIDYD